MKKLVILFLVITSIAIAIDTTGVPKEVVSQIIHDAEERYPKDYTMQGYIVEKEVKAYKTMRAIKESVIKN